MKHNNVKQELKIAAASIIAAGFFAVNNVNAANTSAPVKTVELVKPVANDIPWDCGGFCQKP